MCEECRSHGVDCTEVMLRRASQDQILRLLRDIFFGSHDRDGKPDFPRDLDGEPS